jgi:serine/threonine protein kinase
MIGQGNRGKVYKAYQLSNNELVCVKEIRKDRMIEADKQRYFGNFKLIKGMAHPNIIRYYDLYEEESHVYIVQEYCNGGELFDFCKKQSPFTEKLAA